MTTRIRRSIPERFFTKVDFNGPAPEYRPELGPCWLWTGAIESNGYGWFRKGDTVIRAHRYAYEVCVGPIPEGLEIDHLCRIHPCVNPAHLEAVTMQENQLRGYGASGKNARKTHCLRGHPLSGDNLYRSKGGRRRQCKECVREHGRRYRERQRRAVAEQPTLEDWAGHLRERAEGGGKTDAELREKYGLTPRCERVAVCCGAPYEGGFSRSCAQCHEGSRSYKCAYHGCAWPDGEKECPAKEKVGS